MNNSFKNVITNNLIRFANYFIQFIIITLFPLVTTHELWKEAWTGVRPSAWDGSGHFTLAQIYRNITFPDTFGWTNAFFGGMPHPNNYPPLFYWIIALLAHSHLFTFLTSFKIVLVLPTLLLPVATWFLAWKLSNKNQWIALCSALVMTPLLIDYRFFSSAGPLGISYISTFLTGLYSHPLGYLFLIFWYAAYSDRQQPFWRITLASVLLACSVLSSFFGASITALFIIVTVVYDLLQLRLTLGSENRQRARQSLIGHLLSPVIAGCLTLFWLAPIIATRDYIITQPSNIPLNELVNPALLFWYLIAGAGIILWLRRRQSASMGIYLVVCVVLAAIIFSAGVIAPHWFPLHPGRLLATFNFLLAVPVGLTMAFLIRKLVELLGIMPLISQLSESGAAKNNQGVKKNDKLLHSSIIRLKSWQIAEVAVVLILGIILIFKGVRTASYQLAFYPTENREAIDPLLNFAKDHKDGRYIVETPPFGEIAAGHEGRAINNFLPAQGNEVLSLFFREASPSVVFFSPIVDRFSVQADPTGISSVLSDDIDFAQQSASLHIKQARLMGVRYLVVRSPWARNLLQGQPDIKSRRDFGLWSVYDLGGDPEQHVHPLAYKPALIVSNLNLKGRRNNESGFVRFAEEQIFSGRYDVLLTRSPEMKLDKLQVESGFSALIVDDYDFDDEQSAFDNLRQFAQNRSLILLESDNSLFRHIQSTLADFPQATIINRTPEELGAWLKPGAPTQSYETSQIRHIWRQIEQILDRHKISVNTTAMTNVTGQVEQNKITISLAGSLTEPIPIVIDMTYHPNWQRTDGAALYPTTPFFMLTFIREPAQIQFARRTSDWIGLIISAVTFFLLCITLIWFYGSRLVFSLKPFKRNSAASIPNNKEIADG